MLYQVNPGDIYFIPLELSKINPVKKKIVPEKCRVVVYFLGNIESNSHTFYKMFIFYFTYFISHSNNNLQSIANHRICGNFIYQIINTQTVYLKTKYGFCKYFIYKYWMIEFFITFQVYFISSLVLSLNYHKNIFIKIEST